MINAAKTINTYLKDGDPTAFLDACEGGLCSDATIKLFNYVANVDACALTDSLYEGYVYGAYF